MKTEEIRVLLTPEQRISLDKLRGIAPISAYIRSLIEREWAAYQSTHTPSLQPRPNAGQAPAGNLRGWVRVGNCRARAYSKAAASTEGEP